MRAREEVGEKEKETVKTESERYIRILSVASLSLSLLLRLWVISQ